MLFVSAYIINSYLLMQSQVKQTFDFVFLKKLSPISLKLNTEYRITLRVINIKIIFNYDIQYNNRIIRLIQKYLTNVIKAINAANSNYDKNDSFFEILDRQICDQKSWNALYK